MDDQTLVTELGGPGKVASMCLNNDEQPISVQAVYQWLAEGGRIPIARKQFLEQQLRIKQIEGIAAGTSAESGHA